MLVVVGKGTLGSKTLLQQNLPLVNWNCHHIEEIKCSTDVERNIQLFVFCLICYFLFLLFYLYFV